MTCKRRWGCSVHFEFSEETSVFATPQTQTHCCSPHNHILTNMGKFDAKKWFVLFVLKRPDPRVICSTMILKLAVNRINIHKNKKIELSLQHKKEVADLIEQGKEAQARVRVGSNLLTQCTCFCIPALSKMQTCKPAHSAQHRHTCTHVHCAHKMSCTRTSHMHTHTHT